MKKVHSFISLIVFNFAFCLLTITCCYATPKIDTTPTEKTLELASLFKDHMVLQRDMPIPIWGKAQAGATVTVTFANSEKSTVAGLNGKWRVDLDALKASFESRTMRISSSADKDVVQISDIVVGEVWICSGQSNMQMGFDGIPEIKALTTTASNIRSFNVKRTVAFEPQDSCEGEWVTEQPNSAVAFSFAYYLEKSANVPIGIILTAWGSSSIEAWMPRDMTQTVPHFKTMMEEFDADSETKTRIQSILDGPKSWPNQDDIFLRRQSNILYNAMIHPLVPFACRGLVWYQGERNTQSMQGMLKEPWYSRNSGMLKYGDALQEWIKRYRKEWGKNDFEFLVIMLPGFGKNLDAGKPIDPKSPAAHSWAWMRESQLKALELPHTAVINTIDLGDNKNIHPKDKLPIGKRLALVAIKNNGDKTTKANGPTLKRVTVKKGSLVVHFTNAKDLQTVDGKAPRSFWLADEAGQWFPAEARIKGKSVMLHCSQLKNPLYVRYAFVGKPDVNLVNDANLPAYPFRTDSIKP